MPSTLRIFVNVNGVLTSAEEAHVSPLDHGFLYGDSVYETVRTYQKRPFLLGRHLDRLQRSLDRIFLSLPLNRKELEAEVLRTLTEVPIETDVGARIVVSRGVGPIGLDVTRCPRASYLIYVFELAPDAVPPEASPGSSGGGISIVVSKVRRNSPRALDPAIKSGNFLNNILAFKDAKDAGADEALFCNVEGYLAEGTTSNVFVAKNDFVWTPNPFGILDGITRAVLFEEAVGAGIRIGETNIPPEALFSADEVFITSSIKGVVPVTRVNGKVVGSGARGPITHKFQELYARRVARECGPAGGEAAPRRKGKGARPLSAN
ncbi:MAG TPA: aminotransferase class IV [Planctomycetota bacterium]|nr:aminotransferase class IV [Planctomycetota bacterium]